jgi:hypothetical protein
MPSSKSDDIEVNGLRLQYTRTGSDDSTRPQVVLAHGYTDFTLSSRSVS